MITKMNRRGLLTGAAASCALGACSSPLPPPRAFPDPSFRRDGALNLDVSDIEVFLDYQAPMTVPNVEHRFPVTPERMLRRWAAERLVATGYPGRRARFVIEDASVRENEIARQSGLRAAFTNQQAQLYEGTLRVTVEIIEAVSRRREAFASASATRAQSIDEKASVADRESAWGELCVGLMTGFNLELDRQIRANLGAYLR